MDRIGRITSSFACVLLALTSCMGCGNERRPREHTERRGAHEERSKAEKSKRSIAIFDAKGDLLPSDDVVAGLRLPRGLEVVRNEPRRHVYRSSAPIEKLQRYFGPRLLTGEVDRIGDGAAYRNAVPHEARGGVVRLDVSLLPSSRSGVRIEVTELLPPRAKMPPQAEIERALGERLQKLQ